MDKIKKKFRKDNFLLWILCYLVNAVQVILETYVLIWIVNAILSDIMKHTLDYRKTELFSIALLFSIFFRFVSRMIAFSLERKLTILVEDTILYKVVNGKIKKTPDELLVIIQNSVANYGNQYVGNKVSICVILSTIIAIVVYTSFISIKAVLICLIISITVLLIMNSANKKLTDISKESEAAFNDTYMEVWEYLICSRMLPFCNSDVYRELSQKINKTTESQTKLSKVINISRICERFSNIGIILIISLIYGIKSISGQFYIVDLFSIIILLPGLSDAIFKIPVLQVNLKKMQGIEEILYNTLELFEKFDCDDKKKLNTIESLQVFNLKYRYENGNGCTIPEFLADSGEIIGIYGRSGGGKSTFLKVIMGLLEDYEGRILINHQELLSEINKKSLWEYTLYLGQNPVLLPLNIYENIALQENRSIDDEKLKYALNKADLSEFIERNKNIREKVIDYTNISTGEIQKICIARCFYQKRKVYILDEATNAMSPQSENKIMDSFFDKVRREKSILIIVSHNMQLIKKCDRIYEV